MTAPSNLPDYGQNVFRGAVADKYLKKYGKSSSLLKDSAWTGVEADAEVRCKAQGRGSGLEGAKTPRRSAEAAAARTLLPRKYPRLKAPGAPLRRSRPDRCAGVPLGVG